MPVVITGNNTPTAGGVVYGDGTTYATTTAGTSGRPIVSGGAGAPTFRPYTLPAADGSASQVLQTNGSGVLSFATLSSGLAAATQAEMEAASSNTVAVTPLSTNWHPGVVKAWLKCSGDGLTINASYNITSITDTSAGIVTVTIATDFSSANYSINGTAQSSSSGSPGMKYIHISSQAAGSFVGTSGVEPSVSGPSDPLSYYFACLGDQ